VLQVSGVLQMNISAGEFSKFQTFIYDAFGIVLPEVKKDMLANRLRQMLVDQGFQSFDDYYERRLRQPSAQTLDELINRVSTNHTYFYREARHFEHLRSDGLPHTSTLARTRSGGRPEFRLWCAAASSGQEPYGLAIQLREYWARENISWNAGLLATDISERALSAASKGIYSQEDVESVPTDVRNKYFRKVSAGWEVSKELKDDVLFRRFNLMNKTLPFKKPFDVIFCRNVMIYFDNDTRRDLVSRFHDALYPGGYLYVGLAESLGRNAGKLRMVEPGIYRKEA
jgi:chemotaxis protein methyltransferase CheR